MSSQRRGETKKEKIYGLGVLSGGNVQLYEENPKGKMVETDIIFTSWKSLRDLIEQIKKAISVSVPECLLDIIRQVQSEWSFALVKFDPLRGLVWVDLTTAIR